MYNRDYLSDNNNNTYSRKEEAYTSSKEHAQAPTDVMAFLKSTYQLFASSLMAASVGSYVGLSMVSIISTWHIGIFILEIALLFGLYAVKDKAGINLIVLFAFTFVTGLSIAPLLNMAFGMAGGTAIVAQAFLMTSVAFGGISMFALTTKRDFSSMGKMLFITLIIVVVGSISNIFFQSPIFQLAIAGVSAILFSAFILYDTQQIIKGGYSTPIEAAIALYLDFLNLFVALLQILMAFNSKDD
ncbi:MAG: Bax inhibitor-1/YccA family protein [Campylobacterota bacterium]|nr:Bax inhibitor-1/YccA family protein [Campylobacterota bacterium]